MVAAKLVTRMIGATLLTGLISAIIVALVIVLANILVDGRSVQQAANLAAWVLLAALFIGPIMAVLIAIAAEVPKAIWLSRMSGLLSVHLVSSMIAGVVLYHFLITFLLSRFGLIPPSGAASDQGPELLSFIYALGAPAIGGLVSAGVWWWLVIKPWRSSRAAIANSG